MTADTEIIFVQALRERGLLAHCLSADANAALRWGELSMIVLPRLGITKEEYRQWRQRQKTASE